MRKFEEFEELINDCGDLIFSAVFAITKSRKKSLEIISQAGEKYIECRKKLKNTSERYHKLAEYCEKILKTKLSAKFEENFMSDEEREKILTSIKLYINKGGKRKKRFGTIIFIVIMLVIIAIITFYEIKFIRSDEFSEGMAGWYEKNSTSQNNMG